MDLYVILGKWIFRIFILGKSILVIIINNKNLLFKVNIIFYYKWYDKLKLFMN